MDTTLRVTSAVMKFWHSVKDNDVLRRRAIDEPAAALEALEIALPEGTALAYAEIDGEHHVRATGLPAGPKSWIFSPDGGMRIESEPDDELDELSAEQLEAVAGGITQQNYDRSLECCWNPGSSYGGWCNQRGVCVTSATCSSKYFVGLASSNNKGELDCGIY